jgi:hypothetical protein
MPKKVINSQIDIPLEKSEKAVSPRQTSQLAAKILFEPSSPQAKVKARFWTRFQAGPLADPSKVSLIDALETTGTPQLQKWWGLEGFREWFLNKDEERERLKYLFNKGLDTIEQILDNPEANANAKVNLIKMLAEVSGYLGKKPVEKFADEEVNRMSESQLTEFLEKKGVRITQETIVEVPSEEDKESKSDT